MENLENLSKVFEFHGHKSPGTAMGVFMVDYAIELMNNLIKNRNVELNAVVETIPCLTDAVQIITGCTIGNEKMHVVDYGRFALTLYDKKTGIGIRVKLDVEKTKGYKNLHDWFLKRKPKRDLPKELVIGDIINARRDVLSYEMVRVKIKEEKLPVRFCSKCKEPFSSNNGGICKYCGGEGYYEVI